MCVPYQQGGAEAALAAHTLFHFSCGKADFPASTGRRDAGHAALLLVLHGCCHHLVIPGEFPSSEAAPFKAGCPEEFPAPAQAEERQMSSGRAELEFSQEMILPGHPAAHHGHEALVPGKPSCPCQGNVTLCLHLTRRWILAKITLCFHCSGPCCVP